MRNILKITVLTITILITIIILLFGYRDIPLEELKAKYGQEPSSYIGVDGMDVHFRDEGDPTDSIPIVLIHGTGSSLHTFDKWTEELKKDYRVVRMDLPAYGLTGPFPHRTYTIDQYVTFLNHFLEQKGIEQCIMGGNSLGGQIAWNYTVAYPEKVTKLVLIDAAGYPFEAESIPVAFKLATIPVIKNLFTFITPKSIARSSVESVYADKSKVTEDLADRYFELTLRSGNRQAFVDRISQAARSSDFDKIKAIEQPTLILWGDQDLLIPVENALRFQQDLPNDTLVILENAGHVPMEEVPQRSIEPVLSFLRGFR